MRNSNPLPSGLQGWEPSVRTLEEALSGKDVRNFMPVLQYYQENGINRQLRTFCREKIRASASHPQH